jgi:hypothetical protein
MRGLELVSVVALLEDAADRPLRSGRFGTIVERPAPGVYDVEFADDRGRTYASLPLRPGQMPQPHHQPSRRAA